MMSSWKQRLFYYSKHALSTTPSPMKTKSMVIALGGNAMKKPSERGTSNEMLDNVNNATKNILNIIKTNPEYNYNICITHGNGPQVGSLYLQNQLCSDEIPSLPLTFCGAMSQGFIGYMLQQSFTNNINKDNNLKKRFEGVVTLINQVGVSMNDKAFENPSKPIGKFYSESEAKILEKENGYNMMEDSGRGWRITVGSPKPIKIMELNAIKQLYNNQYIVIATGGGGIPVVIDDDMDDDNDDNIGNNNNLYGIDAVIDKDLTSVLLAQKLWADTLIIATDGDGIWLNYNDKEKRKKLENIEVSELKKYYLDGVWGKYKGSMRPKIEAVIKFVEETGRDAIICDLNDIHKAIIGESGSKIYHKDKEKFEEGWKLFGEESSIS